MDDNTFILLFRKTLESRVFKNEGLLKVWIWCLLKASYKKRWVSIRTGRGETEVEINPGQFIFGRKSAASELKMKLSTVTDRMKKLKNMQNIDIQPDTHYSIISIINWDTYQQNTIDTRQATQQPSDTQPTGNQQPSDTNNKVNKEENVNKKDTPLPPKPKKPTLDFTNYLQEKIIENNFIETKDKIFEFYKYRMSMPKAKQYQTEKGINGLFRDLNGCRDAGLIISDCLEIAMEKPWLTPDPTYFKKNILNNKINGTGQPTITNAERWAKNKMERENGK